MSNGREEEDDWPWFSAAIRTARVRNRLLRHREFCYNTAMDRAKELKAVGTRIRKLREAKGISQEDAARLAGIDRSYYGRIERGLINVSAVFLLKIARMLHCPVGSFFPPA